ncbi:MAG: TCP-1/cpn60 chaperonin family protein [Candidatus Promineifilaceae bacterium]
MPKPTVVFAPNSAEKLKQGFDTLAHLLAIKLGPSQGIVLNEKDTPGPPDILSDAATIARRIIAFPDRQTDVGAMLLRNTVWRVHQRVGDGTATTAVLAQAILHAAYRSVVAGASAVAVQKGIQRASNVVLACLRDMATPANDWETLAAVGHAVTGRQALGDVLGELIELLGSDAEVTIKDYLSPVIERTFLQGASVTGALLSPYMITAPGGQKAIVPRCQIALYGGKVLDPSDIMPLMRLAQARLPQGAPLNILLVAYEFSDEAKQTLVGLHTHPKSRGNIIAFQTTRAGVSGLENLEDLALLTGAEVLGPDKGLMLKHIRPNHLGFAQRIEANKEDLLIVRGNGNQDAIQEQITRFDAQVGKYAFDDEQRTRNRERRARLANERAILHLGALTKAEREYLHRKAEQGVKTVKAARRMGVLPGCGSAFVHCVDAVETLYSETSGDERAGVRAVREALVAPLQQIVRNGCPAIPEIITQQQRVRPRSQVFDVMNERWVDGAEHGLLDSAEVLSVAFETAVSGAVMALSIDCVVHKKKPKLSYEP